MQIGRFTDPLFVHASLINFNFTTGSGGAHKHDVPIYSTTHPFYPLMNPNLRQYFRSVLIKQYRLSFVFSF